jgi:hypothetical protein
MMNWENVDVEKMVFELIEQRAPAVAERLLEMASHPAALSDQVLQLQMMIFEDELSEDDYETAIIALRYARRYLKDPARGH